MLNHPTRPLASADTDPLADGTPSAHLLEELQLYGYRPFQDEPDPRPLPEAEQARAEIGACLETLAGLLTGTRLEDDLDDLLWACVNVFHRRIASLERNLDANEQAQQHSQRDQDGSEIRSVELERLIAEGLGLIERRNAFEFFRDAAAEMYEALTGSTWRPRQGSQLNHRALTAAMIDSRDHIAARRYADTHVLVPPGPKVAFTGGVECNDVDRISSVLDKVHAKHPDMVLLHGGSPKGAERIAACWAEHRRVPQIVYKPDWTRHRKAAPFRRNDQLLESLPIGLVVFPGSGISQNLADKARKMGIPVWRFGAEGGA
ncbi:DUF2493 domain-containing protein [Niveispirillum sp. KHB5.9]|uniref:DUF2493 domain-containing protein n=1 Tax=Niveispirillum sp. KHB5.9 TaxID=3400269 RepID=UPI003A8988DC